MNADEQRVRWDSDRIEGVEGLHFVVTGGNSGLGLESVRQLARHGAKVTLAARSVARGESAKSSIASELGDVDVEVRELDLASLASIKEFAESLSGRQVDGLLNNAGIMAIPRTLTADGFEMQFGVNHLGHFALTALLWDNLLQAPTPRVVTVSSNAHKPGSINFEDLMGERKYSRAGAYAQSKLANLLFAKELQRRAHAVKPTLRSLAAHPGYTATNLTSGTVSDLPAFARWIQPRIDRVVGQTPQMGALPQLYALTAPEVPGGAYIGPDGWQELRGYPKVTNPTAAARDEQTAARLWSVSEQLTGISWLSRG